MKKSTSVPEIGDEIVGIVEAALRIFDCSFYAIYQWNQSTPQMLNVYALQDI